MGTRRMYRGGMQKQSINITGEDGRCSRQKENKTRTQKQIGREHGKRCGSGGLKGC